MTKVSEKLSKILLLPKFSFQSFITTDITGIFSIFTLDSPCIVSAFLATNLAICGKIRVFSVKTRKLPKTCSKWLSGMPACSHLAVRGGEVFHLFQV